MDTWTPCPLPPAVLFDPDGLPAQWERLHRGDAEPLPEAPALRTAWAHYHNGEFQRAVHAALACGDDGVNLANKATSVYATYLEPSERHREALLLQVAERALALQNRQPHNPGAWYWQAHALGRYSQSISVAKALAVGLGPRIRSALENALRLAPEHADAHLALASFHADIIDKVGALIGRMTHNASAEAALSLYQRAQQLNPQSPITLVEHARGLLMLEGRRQTPEALALQTQAAALEPVDAMERLYMAAATEEAA